MDEQQNALAEWIEWSGGKCPVKAGTLVDVKHRDGDIGYHQPAMGGDITGGTAGAWDWSHTDDPGDITAYRTHNAFKDAPDEATHLLGHCNGSSVFVRWDGSALEFLDIGGMSGYNISDTEWQVIATRKRDNEDLPKDFIDGCKEAMNQIERGESKLYVRRTVTAHDTVQAALKHMQDRSATYDKPTGERSMSATVEAFNAIAGTELTEEQGWMFMALLKIVRSQQGAFKADNYEDLAAYAGLMAEAGYSSRGT